MPTDDDDKKVKDVLGETSLADLQRWFTLPSYTALAEEGKAAATPEDDQYKEVREKREKAMAAVEPWFLADLQRRHERWWSFAKFEAEIDVKIKPDLGLFDASMATTWATAEPRERERPIQLEDDMTDRTPQALLRDLHRVESYFDRRYEVYDEEAHQRFNIIGEAAKIMATDLKTLPRDNLPGTDLRAMMAEVLEERARPWSDVPKRHNLVNRRIQE